ncbi:MAG: cyclic nucleotide-binding domain-containing protein [Phyllobacterium sp.]
MALDDDIRILGTVGLFEPLKHEQLRLLAFGAERLSLRGGRELYRENQAADCAYVVASGSIALSRAGSSGPVPIKTVGTGSILGEMALIAPTKRLTSATAEADSEVIRISRLLFRRVLEEYPEVAVALHDHITADLIELTDQISRLSRYFDD